jgi:hypothetical protein
MPVQAEGVFDWLAGLFEDKAKVVNPQNQPVRVAPVAPMQQWSQHNRRGAKNRRQGHARGNNRVMHQAPVAHQPQVRSTNPRAKTTAKVEKIKKTLTQYAGLIALGIVISAAGAVLLNPAAQQKIRDILGYARPAQEVNNLFRDVKDTAKDVKDFAKNIVDTLSGDEEETKQA